MTQDDSSDHWRPLSECSYGHNRSHSWGLWQAVGDLQTLFKAAQVISPTVAMQPPLGWVHCRYIVPVFLQRALREEVKMDTYAVVCTVGGLAHGV